MRFHTPNMVKLSRQPKKAVQVKSVETTVEVKPLGRLARLWLFLRKLLHLK